MPRSIPTTSSKGEPMEFAGFNYPRNLYLMPKRAGKSLLETLRRRRESRKVCGPYYQTSPNPNPTQYFCYLESDFDLGLRRRWADEIIDLRHNGWFTDPHGGGETIRGLVFTLPHGRGFLAGWSMGPGMATEIENYVFGGERDAAFSADDMARHAAERCRNEYDETEEA